MAKEHFEILYFTPALTVIGNVTDSSLNAIAELVYTGINNMELRGRLNVLQGDRYTEFGEKVNKMRVELRMRYFF